MQGSSSDTDDDVSVADATDVAVIARDSRKSRQKMVKITANFCGNRKNHGKNTASNYGPKDHLCSL